MRKFRVVVGCDRLEPNPFVRRVVPKKGDQAIGQYFSQLICISIAGESPQIFVDGEKCKRPCPR